MKRAPHIELPIIPRAVAEAVWEEASVWLDEPLPRRWIRELAAEAHTVYAHNRQFRRRVRAEGDAGREYLWMFTRHWLAAFDARTPPASPCTLAGLLQFGQAVAAEANRSPRHKGEVDRITRILPSLRTSTSEQAWAAAAHFHFV